MDTNSFGSGVGPFGNIDLTPSRDFFAPLASATAAQVAVPKAMPAAPRVDARPKPPLPSLAPDKSSNMHGFMAFCKRNNTTLTVIVLIFGIVFTCMTVYYAHKKAQGRKGPFHTEIMAVSDSERRHDLKELEYLWQIARRKTVKDMLDRALKTELAPEPPQETIPPPPVEAIGNADEEDPFFTAA